jgi:hypothetical protein
MKKNKILIVAFIGLLLAGGLIYVGCEEEGCPNGSCHVSTNSTGFAYIADYCGNGDCVARKVMAGTQINASGDCSCN